MVVAVVLSVVMVGGEVASRDPKLEDRVRV
jgi:hypothetical protein